VNVPPRPDQVPGVPSPGAISPGQSGLVVARTVIIYGTSGGLFVYSPTPALGNLAASIAAAGGHDTYGNTYLAGVVSYTDSGGTFFASQQIAGGLNFKTASGAGGTYGNIAQISLDSNDNLTITSAISEVNYTSLVDTAVAASVNAQSPTASSVGPDAWHSLSLSGTWTGPLRYVLMPFKAGFVALNGTLTAGGTFADGTTLGTISNSAYYPTTTQNAPLTTDNTLATAGDQSPHLTVSTAGVIKVFGVRATGDILGLNTLYPLD
jgi:hypothetical protein